LVSFSRFFGFYSALMNNLEYKAILWDIDGTLIDTTALIVGVLESTFKHFTGKDVPHEELRSLIGIPLDGQVGYLGDPTLYGTTVDEMSAYAVRAYERGRDQERVIPEVVEALIEIKRRGIPTALVTSKSDVEVANSLPRLGVSAYCDAIITADQVAPYYKPHPRPVQLALEKLGHPDPQSVIFIGDSVHDMQSGKAAGVKVAAVLWGAATQAMLESESPDLVFHRPSEIVPALIGEPEAVLSY
jgi:pyrophosphatase PpaX